MQIVDTAPASLPFSIDLAIRHLGALSDDADKVELYCRAAVAAVEDYTGRSLITTTFTGQLERWPTFGISGGVNRPGQLASVVDAIELPRSPLVAITSLKYYPEDGSAQVTWSSANYRADVRSLPGRLVLVDEVELPDLAARQDAIEIVFTAGSGTTESVMPPMLVMACLMLARHFMDNPSAVDMEGKIRKMPLSFQYLLRSQRV